MDLSTLYRRARRAKGYADGLNDGPPTSDHVSSPRWDGVTRSLNGQWLTESPSADGDFILTNARIVMADAVITGTVQIVRGFIAAIETGITSLACATDLQGDYLIPGLVDLHTDNLERHLQPRPGVAWPGDAALLAHDRQAAFAGITTVLDSLCVGDRDRGSGARSAALIETMQEIERAEADRLLLCDHFLHLRCEVSAEGILEALPGLMNDPRVHLASLMDHTPGQRQWADVSRWRQFQRSNELSDSELDVIYERRTGRVGDVAPAVRFEVARLCRQRGIVLASHDDSTAEHVLEAAELGVTISEFPTTAAAARTACSEGMHVVMGAPNIVLNGSHSGNVSARELVKAGLVDALASDYVPTSLIQACFACHQVLGMSMPAAAALVSANPAAMIGLNDRGVIGIGKRADLLWVRSHDHVPVVRGVWRRGERIV